MTISPMNKSPKPKSTLRSLILYISATIVSPLVLAYGLYTGRAVVPVRYGAWDVAQQRHQFLFWLTEAFWLFMTIIGAFVSVEEIRLLRQKPAPAITPAKPAPTRRSPAPISPVAFSSCESCRAPTLRVYRVSGIWRRDSDACPSDPA